MAFLHQFTSNDPIFFAKKKFVLRGIQIIRDTLGGGVGGAGLTKCYMKFFVLKCHRGGGVVSEKCPKSVMYYLNGPLLMYLTTSIKAIFR